MKDKREILLDAAGNIDSRFIEEYENTKPLAKRVKITRYSAIAASLLLVVAVSVAFLPKLFEKTPPPGITPGADIAGYVVTEKRGDFDYCGIIGTDYVADFTKEESGSELAIEWESTVKAMMKGSGIVVKGYIDTVELYQKPHPNGTQYNGFSIACLYIEKVYHDGSKGDPQVKVGDRIVLYKPIISYGEPGFENVNKDNEAAIPYTSSGVYYLSNIATSGIIIKDEYRESGYFPDGEVWSGISSSVEIFEKNR